MTEQNNTFHDDRELSGEESAILARILNGELDGNFEEDKIRPRDVFSPLPQSFSQQRLWILDRLVPGSAFYNLPSAVRLKGRLDVGVLERSLNEVIRRHESLRTVFSMVDEEPVQVILTGLKLSVPLIDLGNLSPGEKEPEVLRRLREEAQTPFDIQQGPLLRVILLGLGAQEHVLLYNMHHIISDSWSMELFIKELSILYAAFSRGGSASLPQPGLQYGDYAVWQRQRLKGETMEKQLSYWRELLSGDLPILEMPTDRQRPAVSTYLGGIRSFSIPESLTAKLLEFNRKENCSLFMSLLGVFNVLLCRYSGQEDILVGSPIANRNRAELEEVIGFFANTLVYRTNLSGNPTFRRLLARVRDMTTRAYDNQDIPFEKLVEELQPERYMSHNPLFQAMLALQNVPRQTPDVGSLEIQHLPIHSGTSKFDLWLSVTQLQETLTLTFEYSYDIFNDSTITRLSSHFQALLEAITRDAGISIHLLEILPGEEKKRLLIDFNNTAAAYPRGKLLHELFAEQAGRTGDKIAVIGMHHAITYNELNEKSNQLARLLKEKGLQPDGIVGIRVERSVEMVIGILGILKTGGAYLPIDTDYPAERIHYMLADSSASLLLTTRSLSERIVFKKGIVYLEDYKKARHAPCSMRHASQPGSSSLAYIIYTSGSTGKPRGVMVAHEGAANRLQWMQDAYGLTPDDRVLQKTPYSFDVSVWEFFWTLLYGAGLVMAEPGGHKDSAYLVKTIVREKITTIHFVPTMLNVFLEDPGIHTIRSLKRVICSGESLPVEYQEKFFTLFDPGVGLYNLYGPTEASVDVTHWTCDRNSNRRLVPIGKPIANTQIYICDTNLNPVPIGVHGELTIGGIQLARGYLNQPELTAEKINQDFQDYQDDRDERGPASRESSITMPEVYTPTYLTHPLNHSPIYRTGDLARWLPDGVIEFLGRLDFQVKVRGFRIELGEIESNLRESKDVSDAAALVMEDSTGQKGKKLVAYVVPDARYWNLYRQGEAGSEDLSTAQITDWQDVFDNAYKKDTQPGDSTFNTAGWNSSYTGAPIPAEEMHAWVDNTVQRVLSYKPRNVMEIGCGTGLFLFRMIPHCRRYLGTDIAQEGLNYINTHLERIKQTGWADVRTMCRSADNFDGIEPGEPDMVILNSVIQYFPTVDYLEEVLEKAAQRIKPGGHIFIGDVRSLPLLKAFHASVELSGVEPGTAREIILGRVLNKIAREQELAIDPLFFNALKKRNPRVKHVEALIKYGRYTNELSKFRYDIILHIGAEDNELTLIQPDPVLEWNKEKTGIGEIEDILSGWAKQGREPGCAVITTVPDARVREDIRALKRLAGMEEPGTARGIQPDDILELAKEYPYHISLQVSPLPGEEGAFDVVFIHRDLKARAPGAAVRDIHSPLHPEKTSNRDSYTNNPLLVKITGKLVPRLRDFLKERLPEYMVPSHFVLLERLPVTANGKLDRRMLPEPVLVEPTKEFAEPTTETEIFLAGLWKEILNLEQVSANHNFFELGGDSVNAIQVVSRAAKQGVEMSVQLLFMNQTIAELAGAIEKNRYRFIKVGENTYTEFMKSLDMDAILEQLPAGVEIEDIYPAGPLQLHQVHFLETRGREYEPVFLYQRRDFPMNSLLDVDTLEKAMQIVSERYRVLRTVIIWKHLKEPVQVVCKKLKFDFSYHDLTAIPPGKKIPEQYELFKQDWNKAFVRNSSSPMRIGIFKLDENLYQYYFTGDYMRMEGWSATRFGHEILYFYEILKSGADIPNPSMHANCYKEYLRTIRILRKQDENPARRYWRSVFKDFSGMKSLTSIPGNQVGQGLGFGISHFYLSPGISARLEQFLLEHRLSFSHFIQGNWAALLGVYFRQDRVVYGMVTTGRSIPIAGIEHMSGHSINILPVVVPISKKKPLLDYLRDIRDIQTEWTRYEYTQVEQVYDWADLPGDRPLFDHYIVVQNVESAMGEIRGMERDKANWSRNAELMFAKMEYPLRLDVSSGYEYCVVLMYYLRFLTTPAVKGLMHNFKTLIESIIENPHQAFEEWTKQIDTETYKSYENESPDGFVQK